MKNALAPPPPREPTPPPPPPPVEPKLDFEVPDMSDIKLDGISYVIPLYQIKGVWVGKFSEI